MSCVFFLTQKNYIKKLKCNNYETIKLNTTMKSCYVPLGARNKQLGLQLRYFLDYAFCRWNDVLFSIA